MNIVNILTNEMRLFMVNDVVAWYRVDPVARRSFASPAPDDDDDKRDDCGETCAYYGINNARCAVGRYLVSKTPLGRYNGNYDEVSSMIDDHPDKWMEVNGTKFQLGKLTESDSAFLSNLQDLHDGSDNWSKKSITRTGLAHAKKLKKIHLSQTT